MTIIHHPSDETLSVFASGTLDEARAVVVATHTSLCAQCRNAVLAFECVGGALLEDAAPAEMSVGALERAMAQLDSVTSGGAPVERQSSGVQDSDEADVLPAPLQHYAMGPWR